MRKRRRELPFSERDSEKWRKSVFGGINIEADQTLPAAATAEGIHNRRSFQKRICC